MSFNYIRKIPSAEEIINELPFPKELAVLKQNRDEEIKAVFERKVISLFLLLVLAQPMMKMQSAIIYIVLPKFKKK